MFLKKIATRCKVCHGTGVVPGNCRADEHLPCPTCQGNGVIAHKISKKRVEEKPCDNPHCHNGHIAMQEWVDGRAVIADKICPVCEGYGVVYREVEEITKESEKCPICFGRGTMRADEMRERGIEDLCPICHGKGFVVDKGLATALGIFCLITVFQPIVALVIGAFAFMIFSVKTVLFSNKNK